MRSNHRGRLISGVGIFVAIALLLSLMGLPAWASIMIPSFGIGVATGFIERQVSRKARAGNPKT